MQRKVFHLHIYDLMSKDGFLFLLHTLDTYSKITPNILKIFSHFYLQTQTYKIQFVPFFLPVFLRFPRTLMIQVPATIVAVT